MKENNQIRMYVRIKELMIDYIVILLYLILLLIANLAFYFLVLGGVPEFTVFQSQLIATFESVLPIVLIFSLLDYKKPYGTYGKRKARLKVQYKTPSFFRSLVRNGIKFLPWQLAHIGIIDGVYTEFTTWPSIVYTNAGTLLAMILLGMGLFRKDKRHLGDLLAGTQVVPLND
ncbi:RDD family protein [Carnobacterium antarcticum]|uniref:RDD family protein n=1 Tax=Carnobacterium antarcticum TaxID=2126436 RepID=A0ABW4NQ61_9LACT|nr:RDD family protein [Carnobacterium sp. CP1]ALV22809.1 hypothetical protein NY10_2224 [Carnobacterium sp. CP1]